MTTSTAAAEKKPHLEVDRVYGGAGGDLLYDDNVLLDVYAVNGYLGVDVWQGAPGPVLVAEVYVEVLARGLGRTSTGALDRQRPDLTPADAYYTATAGGCSGRRRAARCALRRDVGLATARTRRHRARC